VPRPLLLFLLGAAVASALAASGFRPYDRATWLLEVAPVLLAAPVILLTGRRFPLSTLLYLAIALHALVLILGGAYTYARVPLGFWLQDWLHLDRNPYDKLGHFMQGLVPTLAAREILLRNRYLAPGAMCEFLALCVAMAVSACYELVEWSAALAFGDGATDFLGTQGDPWDTQKDMFLALIGSAAALLLFRGLQDRQMARLAGPGRL
jgi:putative membrane protein